MQVGEQRDQLQKELELAMLEADLAATDADEARARVRCLEQRLAASGDYLAGIPIPDTERPASASSCVQALELAEAHLDLVVIGDTLDAADELDQHLKGAMWGRRACQALRT
ncbi:MAG: hypothetical protein HKL82_04290 [Acidimicrobiaceae bacterium]|nr:hypothetical protein [Acidimicrobiaceae bacterium]